MHGIKQLSQEIDVFENKDMVLWFAAEIFLAFIKWENWSDYALKISIENRLSPVTWSTKLSSSLVNPIHCL